jgi:hypothetical protein
MKRGWEGLVGFIRRNVCVPIPQVQSLDELNRMLLTKCRQYAAHQIRGKAASVGVMLTEDKRQMHPLPGYRFERQGRFMPALIGIARGFDTNNYSVPSDCRAREVTVKATPEVVQILYSAASSLSIPGVTKKSKTSIARALPEASGKEGACHLLCS